MGVLTAWLRRIFRRQPQSAAVVTDVASRVVNGPGLVERTRASREAHLARYRDDHGWTFEFGPWVNPHDQDAA